MSHKIAWIIPEQSHLSRNATIIASFVDIPASIDSITFSYIPPEIRPMMTPPTRASPWFFYTQDNDLFAFRTVRDQSDRQPCCRHAPIATPYNYLACNPGAGRFNPGMPNIYTQSPKCGYLLSQPFPYSEAWPACGIYFFKYSQFQSSHEPVLPETQTVSASFNLHDITEVLLKPLNKVDEPTFYGRCIVFAPLVLWSCFLFAYDYRIGEIGTSFMHNILLPIHEAGHALFMPFGDFMNTLGDSQFQLLLPFGTGIAFFWISKDNFGAAIGMWWGRQLARSRTLHFGARHPQLILLGGHTGVDGPHYWIYLLRVLGQLHNAHRWGTIVHSLGGVLMFVALS